MPSSYACQIVVAIAIVLAITATAALIGSLLSQAHSGSLPSFAAPFATHGERRVQEIAKARVSGRRLLNRDVGKWHAETASSPDVLLSKVSGWFCFVFYAASITFSALP